MCRVRFRPRFPPLARSVLPLCLRALRPVNLLAPHLAHLRLLPQLRDALLFSGRLVSLRLHLGQCVSSLLQIIRTSQCSQAIA